MDSKFIHTQHEAQIYRFWEEKGLLSPSKGKPYTVLMPPPNANASLHAGHGMYTADDIMIRFKRLQGYASLWIPGLDHAGIETQFVYEKHLAKKGKSRMDFDRQTLYEDIFLFVKENSGLIYNQFKRLGFLADWKRSVFTLDAHVMARVYETFAKMAREGHVYRNSYIVNYCVHCGTSLAEVEVDHLERKDALYYIKYSFVNKSGHIVVATVRPEPIFVDTHLAVNPKDKKNKHLIGKKVLNPLTDTEMEIIGEDYVDPDFGTGIVKLTPAHDPHDFEVATRRGLSIIQAIDWNGRLMQNAGKYAGLKVKAARQEVVKDLQAKGMVEKIDENYIHSVAICYKCKRDLEPLVVPNWFIKVAELKKNVIIAVKKNKVKFYPKKYKKQMLDWLEIMHDWPISRQNVWGIRIPVWYKIEKGQANLWVWWIDKDKKLQQGNIGQFLESGISLTDIETGLQKVSALTGDSAPQYVISSKKPVGDYLPETDTFDTWFSSGQWPLVTLKEEEYETRYPTDMMGTLADILKFWVSRMIMFSLYLRDEVPFKDVYLWSMVADAKGMKMSKSKGNVINPIDLVDTYGADAFRASLLFGTAQGSKVIMAEEKVKGMRNFANKIWNMARFLYIQIDPLSQNVDVKTKEYQSILKELLNEFEIEKKEYMENMNRYQLSRSLDLVYEFLWHRFADVYIERLKDEIRNGNIEVLDRMKEVYFENLKMLHPFMPFVTEAVWKVFHGENQSILDTQLRR